MKILIILCAFIGAISSRPDGYYKQHYQFKQSSATYKNNELQTKNDDEGFYSKHGDLEGRVAPQVDQHNQHREFVNPQVDGVGHSVTRYDDRDLTDEAENVFSKHQLGVANGGGAQRKTYAYERSYSTSGTQNNYQPSTYGTQSSLGSITQNLQYDLSQQLNRAISNAQSSSSSYRSQSISSDEIRILEEELKANLTRQLQEALRERYGNQGKQGSYSYTITTSGGFNPQANYDNRELTELTKQVQDSLVKQLHEKVQHQTQTYHQESSYGHTNHRDSAEVEDLNRHYSQQPQRQSYTPYQTTQFNENSEGSYHTSNQRQAHYKPIYADENQEPTEKMSYASAVNNNQHGTNIYNPLDTTYQTAYSPNYPVLSTPQRVVVTQPQRVVVTQSQRVPVTQPQRVVINPQISITDVAQTVQNDLSHEVNNALRSFEEKYSSSSYSITGTRPDYQTALDDFKRDLRHNMTIQLQNELDRKYGTQIQRGDYLFSSGSTHNANYRVSDLDELKRQMEDNLMKYLENSFRQQEDRYISQSSSSSYYTSGRNYNHHAPTYTSALTDENAPNTGYIIHRPTTNTQSSHTSYSSSYNSGIKQTPQASSNTQLEQIRRQLEEDMRQQLTAAVQKQKSGHSNYQTQIVVQDLTDELKQNLTQKLEETLRERYGQQGVRGGYSYTVSASGSLQPTANYNSADLSALTQQLQDDLIRQLQQQMNQQQTSSSYTQSQYTSSYIPTTYSTGGNSRAYTYTPTHNMQGGSFQKYNQFSSSSSYGHNNQEVLGEDCTQDAHTMYKRDLGSSYHSDSYDHYHHPRNHHHYNYGQQASYHHIPKQYEEQIGQQMVELDDGFTQQIEDIVPPVPNYHNHYGQHQTLPKSIYQHKPIQYEEVVQTSGYGIPPEHKPIHVHYQTHPVIYHHKPTQYEEELGQQIADIDDGLSQQTEDIMPPVRDQYTHYDQHQTQPKSPNHTPTQNEEVGQKTVEDDEETSYGIPPEHTGQVILVSQHASDSKLTTSQQLSDFNQGQQTVDLDGLSQQPEDDFFSSKSHNADDLAQQPEDGFENLQLDSQKLNQKVENLGQQIEDLNDMTQHTEEMSSVQQLGALSQHSNDRQGKSAVALDQQIVQLEQQIQDLGQQIEDLDGLTQQTEDAFGKLNQNGDQSVVLGQQTVDLDGLSQHTEDDFGYSKPPSQSGSYSNQHLSQQTEDDFTNFEIGSHHDQELGQQSVDLDGLSQKSEDDFVLQSGSYTKPQIVQHAISQQPDEDFGKLEVANQKPEDLSGLSQHTVDLDGFSQHTEDVSVASQVGKQTSRPIIDLSQQFEDLNDTTDNIEVNHSKPTSVSSSNSNFNQADLDDLFDMTQQLEDINKQKTLDVNTPGNHQNHGYSQHQHHDYSHHHGYSTQQNHGYSHQHDGYTTSQNHDYSQQYLDGSAYQSHGYSHQHHGYNSPVSHGYMHQHVDHFTPKIVDFSEQHLDVQNINADNKQKLENVNDLTQQHEDEFYTSQHCEDCVSDVKDQIINNPVDANMPMYLEHSYMRPYSSQHSYQSSGRTMQYTPSSYSQQHVSQDTEAANYKPVGSQSNIEELPETQYDLSQHTEDEEVQSPVGHNLYGLDTHPSYAVQHHLSQHTEEDEPLAVPSSARNLPEFNYGPESHSSHNEDAAVYSKVPQTNYGLEGYGRSLDSIKPIDSTTSTHEVMPPTEAPTFWKKVGGKISNSFSAAKQKAKDIADKLG